MAKGFFEKILFKTKPVFVAFGVKESWLVMRSLCTSPPTPLPPTPKIGLVTRGYKNSYQTIAANSNTNHCGRQEEPAILISRAELFKARLR